MGGRGVPTRAFKIEGCPFYHTGVRPAAAPTRPPTPSVAGRHPLQAQKSPVQSRHRAGGGQPATSRRRRTARQALFSVSAPFSSRSRRCILEGSCRRWARSPTSQPARIRVHPSFPSPRQTQPSSLCPRTWHPGAGRPPGPPAAATEAPIRTGISRPRSASATSPRPKVSLPGPSPRPYGVGLCVLALLLGGHGSRIPTCP